MLGYLGYRYLVDFAISYQKMSLKTFHLTTDKVPDYSTIIRAIIWVKTSNLKVHRVRQKPGFLLNTSFNHRLNSQNCSKVNKKPKSLQKFANCKDFLKKRGVIPPMMYSQII